MTYEHGFAWTPGLMNLSNRIWTITSLVGAALCGAVLIRFETPEWPVRLLTARSWSKSEAELPLLHNTGEGGEGMPPSTGANTNVLHSVLPLPSPVPLLRKSTYHHPVSRMKRRHTRTGTGEEGQWVSKGCAALVDLEVVVSVPWEFGKERRVEVLSPERNFVLYAFDTQEEDWDMWTEAIRQMKAQLFLFLLPVLVSSSLSSRSTGISTSGLDCTREGSSVPSLIEHRSRNPSSTTAAATRPCRARPSPRPPLPCELQGHPCRLPARVASSIIVIGTGRAKYGKRNVQGGAGMALQHRVGSASQHGVGRASQHETPQCE
ncbi:hypothetical protein B0H14DRAFT_3854100 [Mycena olivaceomarginata]|nr:hypothetical protein B0H14DRAFT_3854100 [Mycena olivaceomarginata]